MQDISATNIDIKFRHNLHPFVAVVTYMISQHASMKAKDVEGRCAIDFAIDFFNEDVVEEILQSDNWKEALQNVIEGDPDSDYPVITPMRKLIQSMPDMAKLVLNKCMEIRKHPGKNTTEKHRAEKWYPLQDVPRKTLESAGLDIKFNYDFMDDDYIIGSNNSNETKSSVGQAVRMSIVGIEPTGMESASLQSAVKNEPYTKRSQALMKNHPLSHMVDYEREDLINHPLVTSLYTTKWRSYGSWVYSINLLIYVVFMVPC